MPGGNGKVRKFMPPAFSSNSLSHANGIATSSTSSSSSSSTSAVFQWQWQWQTDDLNWRAFDPAFASAIEAAHASGRSSFYLSADNGSTPTHVVYFLPQTLKQVNLVTRRERPVRRRSVGPSLTVIWEWLDSEKNKWNLYNDQLTSKFETAWLESVSSRTSNKPDSPAGIFFELSGQHYAMLFEADAIQRNLMTSSSRIVRRQTYLLNQPGSTVFTAVGLCNSSCATTVSQRQVMREESKQLKNSECEHSCLIDCPNPKEGENCSVCLSSLQEDEAVELEKCHHIFHRECITQWFKTRPSCPECLAVYGVITGTQPPGNMSIRYIPISSADAGNGLQGYPGTDIIEITYSFPNGIQSAEHPSPGSPYTGTRRVAYLPKNKEGEEVLELLKIAWSRRLLFTVGTSVTTGRSNTVVWAGIHHKTQRRGGSSAYGYPDETYFDRVKQELASVNVM